MQFVWNPKWNQESCLYPMLQRNLISPVNFRIFWHATFSVHLLSVCINVYCASTFNERLIGESLVKGTNCSS